MSNPAAYPRRRRGRGLRWAVIVLVVLLGVLIAADRAAVYLAEAKVSDQLRARFDTADSPQVQIDGFPLLTQAAAGSYQRVQISALGVAAGDLDRVDVDLDLREVALTISDVLAGDLSRGSVGQASADITISQASLSKVTGLPISIDGITDEVARLSTSFEVLGTKVPVTVDAKVVLQGSTAHLDVQGATASGVTIPKFVLSQLADLIGVDFEVPTLVPGMHVDAVSARAGAVVLHATGADVPFPTG